MNLTDFGKIKALLTLIHKYPFTFAGEFSAKRGDPFGLFFFQILICKIFVL